MATYTNKQTDTIPTTVITNSETGSSMTIESWYDHVSGEHAECRGSNGSFNRVTIEQGQAAITAARANPNMTVEG